VSNEIISYYRLAIGRRREAREVKVSLGRGVVYSVIRSLPGSLPSRFESWSHPTNFGQKLTIGEKNMDVQTFEACVKKRQATCRKILKEKGEYYQASDDRLDQFKKAAVLEGTTPIGALGGIMVKHTIKLYDLIAAEENGEPIDKEEWDEVITDHTNYLHLLDGLLEEK